MLRCRASFLRNRKPEEGDGRLLGVVHGVNRLAVFVDKVEVECLLGYADDTEAGCG